MYRILSSLLVVFLAAATGAAASPADRLPGCEPAPSVMRALETGKQPADGQPSREWAVVRQKQLQDLIARHPREYEPYRQLVSLVRWSMPEGFAGLRDAWVKQAAAHPADPLALTLAGRVLIGHDTEAAIRNLREAQRLAPAFPWAALELAQVFGSGKRVDKAEATRQIGLFYQACPASTDENASWSLSAVGTPEMMKRVATSVRAALEKTNDPIRLRSFNTLWPLEFRTRPIAEHAGLRKQVAADVRRLESTNAHPDAAWLILLRDGTKQSGAAKEAVAAVEDRVVRQFPTSSQARSIESKRWHDANPEPKDHTDLAAWKAYHAQERAFLESQEKTRPLDGYLRWNLREYKINGDDPLKEADGVALIEEQLAEDLKDSPTDWSGPYTAVNSLLSKHWQPARALELALQARELYAKYGFGNDENDNASDSQRSQRDRARVIQSAMMTGAVLNAAWQADRPEVATRLVAEVEAPPPAEKDALTSYWANRARLARLQKRGADALAYYQIALNARTYTPKPFQGRLRDDLKDEANALWTSLGGTPAVWARWIEPPPDAGKSAPLTEGGWKEATKDLPKFELADVNGKTWRLTELKGKVVLINLWATWCGPCMAELPHVQKLFEATRDRKDIQVLTFNVDDDLGLVAPFLAEKKFTFPVLPAVALVRKMLDDGLAIPQNWLLDATGKWRLTQIGFNVTETDWAGAVTKKLEALK